MTTLHADPIHSDCSTENKNRLNGVKQQHNLIYPPFKQFVPETSHENKYYY
jgi:hypothetical protein